MTAFAVTTADSHDSRLSDLPACPTCGQLLVSPQSSSYLGLGRIEHRWLCDGCGESFRTSARLAGIVDAPATADDAMQQA